MTPAESINSPLVPHKEGELNHTEGIDSTDSTAYEDAKSEGISELLLGTEPSDSRLKGSRTEMSDNLVYNDNGVLTLVEMESSKRIRRKYGLMEDILDDAKSMAGSVMTLLDETCSPRLRSKRYRNPEQECIIVHHTLQMMIKAFLNEMISGGLVEDGHPLLEPFIGALEIVLHHGWRGQEPQHLFGRTFKLWDLIKKIGKWTKVAESTLSIENIRNMASLKTSTSRIRVWIRLAMMNKSFASDLFLLVNHEGPLLS